MSNTNYDVELNISYNNTYRHYIPTYSVAAPYYYISKDPDFGSYAHTWAYWEYFVSFDSENETELEIKYSKSSSGHTPPDPPSPLYNDTIDSGLTPELSKRILTQSGVYSKVYFRNPRRGQVTFNSSNCKVKVNYLTKAAFEVKLNSSGYIASSNASFKCSTVEKPIPVQYGWAAARVYYKRSTDPTYSSISGTVSGSWSDITVNTNLSLATGYTYNIYIVATADDGTTASTPVSNFATTDGTPVTNCVSPVGTYTQGTVNFIWSHSTEYGTPQYAYDLQYSSNNGGSWTTVANHVVSSTTNRTVTISSAGTYLWRVRTYNTLNQAGSWSQASFINNVPATAPANVQVTTKGRPTITWVATTQSAYQVQMLLNDNIVYDSGAVYSGQNSHIINDYSDDTRAYTVRVRIYNALGSVSPWSSTGYQQITVPDVEFTIEDNETGGAIITVEPSEDFEKYFLKRNDVLIGQITGESYTDRYAIGLTNYSVVAVTADDQSDIQTKGFRVSYPNASIVTLGGAQYAVNKRVDSAFEVQSTNEADFNRTKFIGASSPAHYFNKMKLKSFSVSFFDDNDVIDSLIGTVVFYADNFGNGGYCFVTSYEKTDSFIRNSQGIYGNEITLTLEVTDYDDSIQYPI